MPPAVRIFLSLHDWRGRTMRPFITHGGYGAGDCAARLAQRATGSKILPAFVLEAGQERRPPPTQVTTWLDKPD